MWIILKLNFLILVILKIFSDGNFKKVLRIHLFEFTVKNFTQHSSLIQFWNFQELLAFTNKNVILVQNSILRQFILAQQRVNKHIELLRLKFYRNLRKTDDKRKKEIVTATSFVLFFFFATAYFDTFRKLEVFFLPLRGTS